jgi:hypothetical protein
MVVHVPDYIWTPKTSVEGNLEFEDEYLLDPHLLSGKVRVAEGRSLAAEKRTEATEIPMQNSSSTSPAVVASKP